jgi:ribonucleotide monophosphatase NagD (HAD superfamily)
MTNFFDIDGTVVYYHTNKWLPGAKEMLLDLHKKGHRIIFITMRGEQDEGKEWGKKNTTKLLNELGIAYSIIFDCPSPRKIHDDIQPIAEKHQRNAPW